MHTNISYTDKTTAVLTVSGEADELKKIKEHVLQDLAKKTGNVAGFRKGKAPLTMIEKQLDPALVQSEFLEHVVNDLYGKAVAEHRLRVVAQPQVDVKKYVPYDTVEFEATVEVIGEVQIADYKNISVQKPDVTVSASDVDEVLERLRTRDAEKNDVDRPAQEGDQVVLDFKGVDAKTKDPIAGADGTEYPLVLGSNTFIPGFEPEIIGMKAGEEKSFDITFPEDYGVKDLQKKKVTFTVTAHKVQELVSPELNDAFAAKVGPFKSLDELKTDIKKQISAEREQAAEREYENNLITAIAEKTEVALPKKLVDEEIDRMENEERQNLIYRGQTWEEHLKSEGVTPEEHREQNRDQATLRVKAGIVLSDIAEAENLDVTQEEFDLQLQLLRKQYTDEQMQAELMKPENQREMISRILTQKAVAKVKEYNEPAAPKKASPKKKK